MSSMTQIHPILERLVLGGLFGGAIGVSALLMTGMGHGWNSAATSWLYILMGPAGALLPVVVRRTSLLIPSVVMAALVLGTDLVILAQTSEEGWTYAGNVIERRPLTFAIWISLISIAHLYAARLVVRTRVPKNAMVASRP